MEEKVLINVLRQIARGEQPTAAPDGEYIKALATIGMIKTGWDTVLTSFGRSVLDRYDWNQKW